MGGYEQMFNLYTLGDVLRGLGLDDYHWVENPDKDEKPEVVIPCTNFTVLEDLVPENA